MLILQSTYKSLGTSSEVWDCSIKQVSNQIQQNFRLRRYSPDLTRWQTAVLLSHINVRMFWLEWWHRGQHHRFVQFWVSNQIFFANLTKWLKEDVVKQHLFVKGCLFSCITIYTTCSHFIQQWCVTNIIDCNARSFASLISCSFQPAFSPSCTYVVRCIANACSCTLLIIGYWHISSPRFRVCIQYILELSI